MQKIINFITPIWQIVNEKFLFCLVNQTLRKFLTSRPPKKSFLEETENQKEKEQYSLVISHISEEEGYEKGADVLRTGHEALADKEKSFIAQALARFNIKHEKFAEAIKWGEKAVDIATQYNKGACLDTLGQGHKHALREIRSTLSKSLYKLENLDKALRHSSDACNNFRKSRETPKKSTTNDDAGILLSDIAQASNGLCGMAEVCLSIVQRILLSEDFVKAKNGPAARTIFINLLRNPEVDSIKMLANELEQEQLRVLSKFWKRNYEDLFSHLFYTTKSCIVGAVRLMTDKQIQVSFIAVRLSNVVLPA